MRVRARLRTTAAPDTCLTPAAAEAGGRPHDPDTQSASAETTQRPPNTRVPRRNLPRRAAQRGTGPRRRTQSIPTAAQAEPAPPGPATRTRARHPCARRRGFPGSAQSQGTPSLDGGPSPRGGDQGRASLHRRTAGEAAAGRCLLRQRPPPSSAPACPSRGGPRPPFSGPCPYGDCRRLAVSVRRRLCPREGESLRSSWLSACPPRLPLPPCQPPPLLPLRPAYLAAQRVSRVQAASCGRLWGRSQRGGVRTRFRACRA